jgi:hypothetical protein
MPAATTTAPKPARAVVSRRAGIGLSIRTSPGSAGRSLSGRPLVMPHCCCILTHGAEP